MASNIILQTATMNTFTFFALLVCVFFAFAGAVPSPVAAPEDAPELLEGAESQGYGYGHHNHGGHHGHHGHDHGHNHGHNYGHHHHHHGGYGR